MHEFCDTCQGGGRIVIGKVTSDDPENEFGWDYVYKECEDCKGEGLKPSSFLHTIDEIAEFAADTRENIIEFIREDKILHIYTPDGILIPLGAFQSAMLDLYDFDSFFKEIERIRRDV